MSNEREDRIKKLADIRAMGVIPYAPRYKKTQTISQILENRQSRNDIGLLRNIDDIIVSTNREISTAGRLTLYRSHGKLAFGKLLDESGEIQIMFHRDNLKMLKNRVPHKVNQGDQTFDPNDKHLRRHVVKMVIIDDNGKVATSYAGTWGNYSLPGGGVDEGDNFYDAVHREAREETGTPAKVIYELPKVHEYLKKRNRHQLVYGFLCKTDGEKGEPEFIESEILDGFEIQRLDIYDLRNKIQHQVDNCETNPLRDGLDGIFKRDLIILESAIAVLEKQKIKGEHEGFEDITEISDGLTLGEQPNDIYIGILEKYIGNNTKKLLDKLEDALYFLESGKQSKADISGYGAIKILRNDNLLNGLKNSFYEDNLNNEKAILFICNNIGIDIFYIQNKNVECNSYKTEFEARNFLDEYFGVGNFSRLEDDEECKNNSVLLMTIIDSKKSRIKNIEITPYKFVEKYIDVGDFIGIKGELFTTHKGEATIFVSEFQLLSKAIRPLGDKFHGIGENAETAYRQRYLDMIHNRETIQRFKLRSKFTKSLRDFYHNRGFIEIETPILGNSASGAAAAPFTTHHNDFDIDMYLHIAPETSLKKATVGGLEKVFEITKNFRNEGSDPSHHQEYTTCEHYAAYRNYEDNIRFTEDMFDYIFDNIPELSKVINVVDKEGNSKEVNFQTPRQRIDYVEQIKKDSGIDVSKYGAEDEEILRSTIKEKGFLREGIDKQTTATMIDYLYKKVTRPKIVGPAFIINYPKTMQPLARTSDLNGNIVEQFQLLVNGRELLKAYSELVDPIEQQANFDAQAGAVAKGDDEATKGDDDFVLAMEYGMPCQSGRGMGIDRIFAMLTEQPNIRDVILFPMIKPEKTSE